MGTRTGLLPGITKAQNIRAVHITGPPHMVATARVNVGALVHSSVFRQETLSQHSRAQYRVR